MLRGFEEGVKDEDVFGSTTMTESERMLLSRQAATRVADGNAGSEQTNSDLEITEMSLRPEKQTRLVSNMLDTCFWTHTTKRVSLVFHVDDFLLAATHQIIKEILTELSRDLEERGDDKTNALLGTNPGKNEGEAQLWS